MTKYLLNKAVTNPHLRAAWEELEASSKRYTFTGRREDEAILNARLRNAVKQILIYLTESEAKEASG